MNVEGLGVVLTTLTGLVIAIGGLLQQRSARKILHAKETEAELERKATQFRYALLHVTRLEDMLAAAGKLPPDRPEQLTPGWDPNVKKKPDDRDDGGRETAKAVTA
jgi:hypothetical protein